jgi:DNA repair exonuclease SbcCD nuclease subunit
MKIQVFSDIHVEGLQNGYKVLFERITPQADVAIVAGDIDTRNFEITLQEIGKRFKKVFCIYGNHEFYHRDIDWRPDMKLIPENVTILDRTCEEYEGKLFMGCTLWTDFKNQDWFVLHRADDGINDFHAITANNGGTRFTANMAYEKHLQEKGWLKVMLDQNREKEKVVITHFLPTYQCVHPRWKGGNTDTLNYYFAANCEDLIEDHPEIKAWVFGHTHDRRELEFNGIPFYCNPLGYGAGKERRGFGDPYTDMVIDV